MKRIFLVVGLFLMCVQSVSASEVFSSTQTVQTPAKVMVFLVGAAYTGGEEPNSGTVSFEIQNDAMVRPGVRYALELYSADRPNGPLVERTVYPDVLTLDVSETRKVTIPYTFPKNLQGDYILTVSLFSVTGYEFDREIATKMRLQGTSEGNVYVNIRTCRLSNEKGDVAYKPGEGFKVSPGEVLMSTCDAHYAGSGGIVVTPRIETHSLGSFEPLQITLDRQITETTFSAFEEKKITTPIPTAAEPGTYTVFISYGGTPSTIGYTYTVEKSPTRIQSIGFDKGEYAPGDVAWVTPFLFTQDGSEALDGEDTNNLPQKMVGVIGMANEDGMPCTTDITFGSIANRMAPVGLYVTRTCKNPNITLNIIEAKQGIVASALFAVKSPQREAAGAGLPEVFSESPQDMLKSLIVLGGLVLVGILLWVLYAIRRSRTRVESSIEYTIPKILIVGVFMGSAMLAGVGYADASCTWPGGDVPWGPGNACNGYVPAVTVNDGESAPIVYNYSSGYTGSVTFTCVAGGWQAVNVTCNPLPAPSARFTSTPSCTIADGYGGCETPVSWTAENAVQTTLTNCNDDYLLTGFGNGPFTAPNVYVPYSSGCYRIHNGGPTGPILKQVTINSSCANKPWNAQTRTCGSLDAICGTADGTVMNSGFDFDGSLPSICLAPLGGGNIFTYDGFLSTDAISADKQTLSLGSSVDAYTLGSRWRCDGLGGGRNQWCMFYRQPACGTAHNATNLSAPPTSARSLCGIGTPTAVITNQTTYTWSCTNPGAVPASCTAGRLPVANTPPIANAGPDVTISSLTSTAMPNGAAASDAQDSFVIRQWSYVGSVPPGAPAPTITGGNTLTPTFSNLTSLGSYTFRLTVTDSGNLTSSDDMIVNVVLSGPGCLGCPGGGGPGSNDVDIDVAVCEIGLNQSSCTGSVSWDWVAGRVTDPRIFQNSTQIAGPGTSVNISAKATTMLLGNTSTTFSFRDGTTNTLESVTVMAQCQNSLAWSNTNGRCELATNAPCPANPNLDGCNLPGPTPSGMSVNGLSCGNGYSGSCNYTCTNGNWSANTQCTPPATGCPATTVNGCTLRAASDGENSVIGACGTGYTPGACNYRCTGNTWVANTACTPAATGCPATTINGCTLSASPDGALSVPGRCEGGFTGTCNFKCAGTTWTPNTQCTPPSGRFISFSNNGPINSGSRPELYYTVTGWYQCNITRIPQGTQLGGDFNGDLGTGGRQSWDNDVLTSNQTYRLRCWDQAQTLSDYRDTTVVVTNASSNFNLIENNAITHQASLGALNIGQSVGFYATYRTDQLSEPITVPITDDFTYRWNSSDPWTPMRATCTRRTFGPLNPGATDYGYSDCFGLSPVLYLNRAGTLQVQHCVDSNRTITETVGGGETDNCNVTSFTVSGTLPNLTAAHSGGTEPLTFNNPVSIPFSGTLANADAPTFRDEPIYADVEIDWNNSTNCSTGNIDRVYPMTSSSWRNVGANWSQPVTGTMYNFDLQNGTHCYRIVVDRDNFVTESNNNDNTTSWRQFSISGLPQPTVTGTLTAPPECVISLGASFCTLGVNWTTSYDPHWESNAIFLGADVRGSVSGISNRDHTPDSDILSIGATPGTGGLSLFAAASKGGALLDYKQFQIRCEEGAVWNVIQGRCNVDPNPKANLTAKAGPTVNGQLTKNSAVTFSGTVKNTGAENITRGFYDNFTYCWRPGCTNWTQFSEKYVSALAVNAEQTDTSSNFTLSQGGLLRVQFCIDSRWNINESDETVADNCKITEFMVDAGPGPMIDEFKVCDGGTCKSSNSDLPTGNYTIVWNAPTAERCDSSGFNSGGQMSGNVSVTVSSGINNFTIICEENGAFSTKTIVITGTTVGNVPNKPKLFITTENSQRMNQNNIRTVQNGDRIKLWWDITGTIYTEDQCYLTGGGSTGLITGSTGAKIYTIQGKTKFILDCGGGASVGEATVEVVPTQWNS